MKCVCCCYWKRILLSVSVLHPLLVDHYTTIECAPVRAYKGLCSVIMWSYVLMLFYRSQLKWRRSTIWDDYFHQIYLIKFLEFLVCKCEYTLWTHLVTLTYVPGQRFIGKLKKTWPSARLSDCSDPHYVPVVLIAVKHMCIQKPYWHVKVSWNLFADVGFWSTCLHWNRLLRFATLHICMTGPTG